MSVQPMFDIERLTSALRPFRLHYFPELPSTNDKAIELRKAGSLFAPAILLTDNQTAGRGRGANRWLSNDGSLTVTYVLPIEEHLQPHQLPLVAGIAVRNAAAELTGDIHVALKWPNDVVHAGRKLAGMLCERVNGVDIVGIGVNVNDCPATPDIRMTALSLATIGGRHFDRNEALIVLTGHLKQSLLARHSHPFGAFLDEYRKHDELLGREIVVETPGEEGTIRGTCEGVDEEGRLLVRSNRRLHRVIAGSIRAFTKVM